MIRVAIVDDEKKILDFLQEKILQISQDLHMEIILECFISGEEMLSRNKQSEFHIIMLDLEMPGMDGLAIASILRKDYPDIVLLFITNREDLVFRSFEYEVLGFVRKSHIDDELRLTLDRAYQKVLSKMTTYVLKTEDGERIFTAGSICYILSKGHHILLFDDKGNSCRIVSTLEKLEDLLSPTCFVRCHSGIIVNCQYIYSINNTNIVLTNNEKLALSRQRVKKVRETFQKYLRRI